MGGFQGSGPLASGQSPGSARIARSRNHDHPHGMTTLQAGRFTITLCVSHLRAYSGDGAGREQ